MNTLGWGFGRTMRILPAVLLLIATSITVAEPQPPAGTPSLPEAEQDAPPLTPIKKTYFLVDASGSMKDEVGEATKKLAAKVTLLETGTWKSVTFFGGKSSNADQPVGCDQAIQIAPATHPDTPVSTFPPLGGDQDKTAIGKTVEAAILDGGATASVVLITDGVEECGADFDLIRARYPEADIEILQVGKNPNPDLQRLGIKPVKEEPAPPATPAPVSVELSQQPLPVAVVSIEQRKTVDPWAVANWPEKYLWVLAYTCVGIWAAFFGSSYVSMSVKVEAAISALEDARRKKASSDPPDDISEDTWPATLTKAKIAAEGRRDRIKSGSALCAAFVLVSPLALASGIEQIVVGLVVFLIVAALAAWLFFGGSRTPLETLDDERLRDQFLPSNRRLRIWLGLALLGECILLFSVTDMQKARDAAWVVLSSNFSGALAVAAAAPLLFVGARWWNFVKAKFEYVSATNDAISEEIRTRRDAARRTRVEWQNHRIQLANWQFPLPFFSRLSPFRESVAKRNRDAVVQWAKSITRTAGGENPSADANKLLSELLSSRGLEDLVRLLIKKNLVEDHRQFWEALANALAKNKDKEITSAFANLAAVKPNSL